MSRCVFCAIAAGRAQASTVYSDGELLAFMDIHPCRPGHLLVVPRQHTERLGDLPETTGAALFCLGVRLGAALRACELSCDDVHLLVNDGRAASQTVPHVHLHVVPRWRGDFGKLLTNLLARPLVPLLRPAPRALLDQQARQIGTALARHADLATPEPAF